MTAAASPGVDRYLRKKLIKSEDKKSDGQGKKSRPYGAGGRGLSPQPRETTIKSLKFRTGKWRLGEDEIPVPGGDGAGRGLNQGWEAEPRVK